MSREPYPDRDAWPAYWQAIRSAALGLLVIVVLVGVGTLLPRPDGLLPRIAMEMLIAILVVAVATFVARRVNAWRDQREP